jgi:hypothetical protein
MLALASLAMVGAPSIASAWQSLPPAPAERPAEIMGLPVPGPVSSPDVTPAIRAIEAMVAAYRAAPVLVDEMRLQEVFMNQLQPELAGRVILGPGTDCVIEAPRSRVVSLGDRFYFETEQIRSRYVDAPLRENIVITMREVMFTRPALGWQAKARYGDPPESVLFALSFGVPDPTTISGYERVRLPDGRDVHRVTLMARSGWSIITIDAETNLLIAIDVDYEPAGAPIENFRITRHVRANPQVLAALPEPITFDSRDRRPVLNRDALYGRTVVGQPVKLDVEVGEVMEAPALVTLEGEPWSPADRRGRVQVIVAWNLGSVQFRRGLPPVLAVRDHIKMLPKDIPVDMWLMNTRENTEETEDGGTKWDAVYDFWFDRDYEIPCLFDEDDEVAAAIGLREVPTTLVLDTSGRLVGTQGGLDGTWPELVIRLIDQAITASRAAKAGDASATPPTAAGPRGPGSGG